MILLIVTLVAAEPSAEALKLGREIAESGTLASLLPMMFEKRCVLCSARLSITFSR